MVVFTAEENGFIVEADGKKLRVSYEEYCGSHSNAMAFCKEQGGGDETVENLRFITRHRDAINDELRKLGKKFITGWYWANEVAWWGDGCAFAVNIYVGDVRNDYCSGIYYARAISVL